MKKFYYPILCLLLLSCSKEKIEVKEAAKSIIQTKISNGEPITISCEGTSLTYGQQNDGTVASINGATQMRSVYQYPESLQEELRKTDINITVTNRGYPGDRTTEGLSRWGNKDSANIVILEYATNDLFNYAAYPDGVIDTATYKINLTQLVRRRLNQGSIVIISLSPDLQNPDSKKMMDNYRKKEIEVATEMNILTFDTNKSFSSITIPWIDGVHLKAESYKMWGIGLAEMIKEL